MLLVQKPCTENHQIKMYCSIPISSVSSPPRIPGSNQHTQVYHKTSLQPRKLSFVMMPSTVPFLPSTFPNNQGLPVIRTLGARLLVGQLHVFSLPHVSLHQAGSQTLPLLPLETFATLANWLNLALLQNPEHLDGIVHKREGRVPCRAETSAQGTSERQGLREMASWCR